MSIWSTVQAERMTAALVLQGQAEVYAAGANASRRWPYNNDRQQEAEVLEAMEVEARHQAQVLAAVGTGDEQCHRNYEHKPHLWLLDRKAVRCSGVTEDEATERVKGHLT